MLELAGLAPSSEGSAPQAGREHLETDSFRRASQTQFYWGVILPADGHQSCQWRIGDFGTSPIFVQLSDKLLLASI